MAEEEYVNEGDYEENYEDDDDVNYIMQQALTGNNMKEDPASVRSRPRNTPVSKLELKDEDLIPKMPEKILPMPLSQEKFDEEKQRYIDLIREKTNSIKEAIKERTNESLGIKGEKDNVFNQKKALFDEIQSLKSELNKLEDENNLKSYKADIDYYQGEMNKYSKMHFPTSVKGVEEEIRNMQENLSFGELTANEEKQIHEKKSNLEDYLKNLKKVKELKEKYKEPLKKSGELKKKIKEKNEKLQKIKKSLEEAKQHKVENNPRINQINKLIELLKEDKEKIRKELSDFVTDQTQKWNEYNEQQGLIDYIERAKARIKQLKLKEKKEEKKKKNEEKKNVDVKSDIVTQISSKKLYDDEIKNCDYLLNYFTSIKKITPEETKKEEETKNEENKDDGKLKIIKREEEEFGVSGEGKKKKKGKKPKVGGNKKEGKKGDEKKIGINLDIQMLNLISSFGLTAPTSNNDIDKFIKEVNDKKAEYEKKNTEVVAEQPKESEKESNPEVKE